jgi:hypothetical protein
LQRAKNEAKEAKFEGVREEGGLLPESMKADMRERIKMLEKENQMLKIELESKFDKDKMMI